MLILTAADLVVLAHQRDQFAALKNEMLRDVQPVNSVQIELFNQALRAAWNVRRFDEAERDLCTNEPTALITAGPVIARLHRLRAQAERAYRQALAELRKTQTDRAIRQLKQNKGLDALPVPIDTKAYVAAARLANGIAASQPISFPPYQAALDRFVEDRDIAPNAWQAFMNRAASPPRRSQGSTASPRC